MNFEQALGWFRVRVKLSKSDNFKNYGKVAISALEKRIPKKVKIEMFNRYNIYYCPICDGCIGDSLGHIGDGFCASCGQALDWSDTE